MSGTPFKVKAVYDYSSPHEDDLSFSSGQIITVNEEEDADWYGGEYIDESGVKQEGIFPRNFVEKYEPTAPPRPMRTRTKKEEHSTVTGAVQPQELPTVPVAAPKPAVEEPQELEAPPPTARPKPPASKATAPTPAASSTMTSPKEAKSPVLTASAAPPKPKPSGPPPPAATEKPSSGSFRDRIAAFNKPAAPPIAPFKPSGLGAGSKDFIKKPYVPPPPSRNAYVPPPREAPPQKAYRRDEDPEIKEREAENLENAEKAGLVAGGPAEVPERETEDQPKPTSLKERIALLQKQQIEQAQRHAEAAAKKEKPKRPPKKRIDSHEAAAAEGQAEATAVAAAPPPPVPTLTRDSTEDSSMRTSLEEARPPRAPQPQRRKSSRAAETKDGNEADMSGAGDTTEGQEDLTEREDSDEKSRHIATAAKQDDEALGEEEVVDEEDEGEEEEVDPEIRRKEELRARMAKMSGAGGGMNAFMFGLPGMANASGSAAGPAPPRRKKPSERRADDGEEDAGAVSTNMRAPPVPTTMALPGLSIMKSPPERPSAERDDEDEGGQDEEDRREDEDETPLRTPHQENAPPTLPSREPGAPPPVPGGRPAPPPIPAEARPVPAPPSAAKSPSIGSESDDEASDRNVLDAPPTPRGDVSIATRAPPPPPVAAPSLTSPASPRSSSSREPASPSVSMPTPSKRNSRPPPPIPGVAPAAPAPHTRAPPPPPPPGGLGRTSTRDSIPRSPAIPSRPALRQKDVEEEQEEEGADEEEEEEVTEYEGDYDTDIASSAPHRDALRSHDRESSFEEPTPIRSPTSEAPANFPPPVPSGGAPRAPPPIPSQPPPPADKRRSTEVPRAAPPLPPLPPKDSTGHDGGEEYDPFNYSAPSHSGVPFMGSFAPPAPGAPPQPPGRPSEEGYAAEPSNPPPAGRAPPPAPAASRALPSRPSQEISRPSGGPPPRRSTDLGRPSMESGHFAHDLDLASQSGWWLQPNSLPPQLQGRKDIFFESEESTASSRGGKTVVTRDIYILYQDYSQTIITVEFDPHDNNADVSLEQRHEPPPRTLRQDQLEASYERFSRPISEAVAKLKDTVVGDGTPHALVYELLKPYKDALLPVGTRAYGALVYSNLANASTAQHDEIRPGDVVSIRNAKFQGKHGPMHAKYSMEVGKPDHVGIVAEWDGTKKKVRAWEQGREGRKVRMESFKLDDLRSGEVKVWRVMARSWVGWEGGN